MILSQLISSACVLPVSLAENLSCDRLRRTWQANHVKRLGILRSSKNVRERSGRCKQMHQQYLQKVTGFSQGTRLSLEQTRKELMSALIRAKPGIDGELQSVAFLLGRGCTWGRGDYRSTSPELLYLKSAWAHHLCSSLRGCGRTSGSGNLFSCRPSSKQRQCCALSNY